ncbi:MAG TPA: hypothetical protein PLR65_14620 [Anaerolineales bacterium]|nr:hypothetical protein [Anaerolineales bacterium]
MQSYLATEIAENAEKNSKSLRALWQSILGQEFNSPNYSRGLLNRAYRFVNCWEVEIKEIDLTGFKNLSPKFSAK